MLSTPEVGAQPPDLYPIGFSQLFNQSYFFNSASHRAVPRLDVSFTNRTMLGLFNEVSQNYVSANIQTTAANSQVKHSMGILALNKNEGEYIQRNRLYVRYATVLDVSTKSTLSLGSSFGLINHLYESSDASGGGSALAKDINIGFVYSTNRFQVGASVNQLFYPELQALNERIRFNRYYNLTLVKEFEITEDIQFESRWLTSFTMNDFLTLKTTLLAVFYQRFHVGTGYNFNQGIDAHLGIRKMELGANKFGATASFLVYNTRKLSTLNDRSVELSLKYFIE